MHRELFGLHPKEGEMLKYPTKSRRPALGIPCPPNCIQEETNAYHPPDEPGAAAGEVEKNPCHDHGDDSHRGGVCRPGRPQCKTCSENSCSLQAVADRNRESRKDPALRGGGRVHGFGFQSFSRTWCAYPADRVPSVSLDNYRGFTFSACKPLGPLTTSNCTC